MALEAWLPIGFELAGGASTRSPLFEGPEWQVLQTQQGGRALVVQERLAERWLEAGLVDRGYLANLEFGNRRLWFLTSESDQVLCPIADCRSPDSKAEALAFALALKATRSIDPDSPLQDALYVEKLSRLLPTYGITSTTGDDVVLGYWLTGGAAVSVKAFRRLDQMMSWLGTDNLSDVISAAGLGYTAANAIARDRHRSSADQAATVADAEHGGISERRDPVRGKDFELAGRPGLAQFFNEHVVDIVLNRDRYKKLGIDFPAAIALFGPPGCGKTFAVERLIDFLGWPSFEIDASSVASPYIHETSKKVAEVFGKAMDNAPSVLVIDEMEAFLADREGGVGQHRVEEVAEFLRRIPEAAKHDVLIIAMTNRIEMIDPAILRRGRFDHVVKVDYASEEEVRSLLDKLLHALPREADVDSEPLAKRLSGRPLSDVTFVVREGARLAARAGKEKLDMESLTAALSSTPAREREGGATRRIGFI